MFIVIYKFKNLILIKFFIKFSIYMLKNTYFSKIYFYIVMIKEFKKLKKKIMYLIFNVKNFF